MPLKISAFTIALMFAFANSSAWSVSNLMVRRRG